LNMNTELDMSQSPEFEAIWGQAKNYTMTSPERGFALYSAVCAMLDQDIPGSCVECGVWKGGSSMIIALTLKARGVERDLYMFDTYEGMTEPGRHDLDLNNMPAQKLMEGSMGDEVATLVKAQAGLDDVKAAMEQTGYNMDRVHFVKGDIRQTALQTMTGDIGLLRLDTDFYDSTLVELEQFYPRLNRGGILIIDDFGHWQGASKAFHDYFERDETSLGKPMLWRIDYTGYGGVKSDADTENMGATVGRYDYIPPGMTPPDLLELFPHAPAEDPRNVQWEYLRSNIPHIWRSDTRDTTGYKTGNASVEEATCLHELARQFKGKRGLEIGSHFGWTGAHLLSTGMEMDFIDPEFADPVRKAAVLEVLDKVAKGKTYRTWAGYSPEILDEVRNKGRKTWLGMRPQRWSFAFIDGNHDGDSPGNDAKGVLPHLAPDAVVVFHDLTSPYVEKGLFVMQQAGFKTCLFNTMQILGVAWRGNVTIPDHIADPNVLPVTQSHLAKYSISPNHKN